MATLLHSFSSSLSAPAASPSQLISPRLHHRRFPVTAASPSPAAADARVSILARNLEKLDADQQSIRLATGIDVDNADVCNQGVFVLQELESHDLEQSKFMIDVNVIATFHLIKATLPGMKGRKGCCPGSIAIISPQAGQVSHTY
ncbi:hypothetical protein DCAR_0727835 [Daucus carota subsp. sativus]|uniref:Uncharacterized protein n=1 Tax=Daucus carota subsp. sativus TaxID=79200 RepID=A0A161X4Q0_DAUCS|nr:hypothetical protein DCAR_0727835 [Daucus carota subsp. sativus]